MAYSDLLKKPQWQKVRLKILERDNWTCQNCGDIETTLNVHHLKYSKVPWDVDDRYLITLCERCHNFEENEKKIAPEIFELAAKYRLTVFQFIRLAEWVKERLNAETIY